MASTLSIYGVGMKSVLYCSAVFAKKNPLSFLISREMAIIPCISECFPFKDSLAPATALNDGVYQQPSFSEMT